LMPKEYYIISFGKEVSVLCFEKELIQNS
jgi:hypothetical protein